MAMTLTELTTHVQELLSKATPGQNSLRSLETAAYVARVFPCEPECGPMGICTNCAEEVIFSSGYNMGTRDFAALLSKLCRIVEVYDRALTKIRTNDYRYEETDDMAGRRFSNTAAVAQLDVDAIVNEGEGV